MTNCLSCIVYETCAIFASYNNKALVMVEMAYQQACIPLWEPRRKHQQWQQTYKENIDVTSSRAVC